jgi:hypothetical protein
VSNVASSKLYGGLTRLIQGRTYKIPDDADRLGFGLSIDARSGLDVVEVEGFEDFRTGFVFDDADPIAAAIGVEIVDLGVHRRRTNP